jgi:hypothetical protein
VSCILLPAVNTPITKDILLNKESNKNLPEAPFQEMNALISK